MINKLIVSSESSNLHSSSRFLEEGRKLSLETIHINPYEKSLNLSSPSIKQQSEQNNFYNSLYLFRTTGIRFDHFDLIYAQSAQVHGAKVVNPLEMLPVFQNKDAQTFFLSQNNISTIPTFTFRGPVTEEIIDQLKKLSPKEQFIFKSIRGNGGIGVMLLKGFNSLLSVIETFHALKDQRFIIQPFVEHEIEYRVLLSTKKILGVIERAITSDDFRGNSKRSKGTFLNISQYPQNLIDHAQHILRKSRLDYAGIDLFIKDGQYYVLEVNTVPGFKQMEELSDKNIARELILDFLEL